MSSWRCCTSCCLDLQVTTTLCSSLNISRDDERWPCSFNLRQQWWEKIKSFEKKKPFTYIEEQSRWEYFFERGSWVSRIGPWVEPKKKKLLNLGQFFFCDSTFVIGFNNWMSTSSSETKLVQSWGAGSLRPAVCIQTRVIYKCILVYYPTPLASWTLIILFLEMLKFVTYNINFRFKI
jgi:hypothetical protein